MKKIKDERLVLQQLKNFRVAFIVQTLGIIAILAYIGISDGLSKMTEQPLWFVFMITMIVFLWSNLRISLDVYDHVNAEKKPAPYYRTVIIIAIIGTVIGLFARFGPDQSTNVEAIFTGLIIFICFLIPFTFIYHLRKKRLTNEDD